MARDRVTIADGTAGNADASASTVRSIGSGNGYGVVRFCDGYVSTGGKADNSRCIYKVIVIARSSNGGKA